MSSASLGLQQSSAHTQVTKDQCAHPSTCRRRLCCFTAAAGLGAAGKLLVQSRLDDELRVHPCHPQHTRLARLPGNIEPLTKHMLQIAAAGLQLAFASHESTLQWLSGLNGSDFSSFEHPSGPASPDENRQQNAGGPSPTHDNAGSGSSRTQQLKVDQLPFKVRNGGTLAVAGRRYATALTCARR